MRLVVQIREEGQSSTGAPLPGEFSVWAAGVSVRNVTESSSDAVTTEEVTFLSWPPNEVSMVGAGATPTLGHFQRLLSAEFGIPFDDLAVFKFVPRLALWVPLKPGMKSSTKKGKKSGGNSGKVENIILAPYTFRDGDLVAVVDLRTCGKSGSASVDGDPSDYSDLFVDRIEDAYDRWLIEEYEKTRLVYKSGNKSGKKRPIVEITLRFGGDLDFSDDDEDSN
ncbi:unnamed protein product [Symbiodinium microadriaticum]|nr:unnamed protein product [Symbiodinium microadriaticum]